MTSQLTKAIVKAIRIFDRKPLTAQGVTREVKRLYIPTASHTTITAELARLVKDKRLVEVKRPGCPRRYRLP